MLNRKQIQEYKINGFTVYRNFLNKISMLDIKADFSHAEDICNGIFKISTSKKRMDNIILSSGKCTRVNDILAYLINKK